MEIPLDGMGIQASSIGEGPGKGNLLAFVGALVGTGFCNRVGICYGNGKGVLDPRVRRHVVVAERDGELQIVGALRQDEALRELAVKAIVLAEDCHAGDNFGVTADCPAELRVVRIADVERTVFDADGQLFSQVLEEDGGRTVGRVGSDGIASSRAEEVFEACEANVWRPNGDDVRCVAPDKRVNECACRGRLDVAVGRSLI